MSRANENPATSDSAGALDQVRALIRRNGGVADPLAK